MAPVFILYLDQNHWIELAKALKNPDRNNVLTDILERLIKAVKEEKIVLPLTSTNIYETYKINRFDRRECLALIQAKLSQGKVFAGRHRRLCHEIKSFIGKVLNQPTKVHIQNWFLSDLFFEAFADWEDDRLELNISQQVLNAIRSERGRSLYDFLMREQEERQVAVRNWSAGTEVLRQKIEQRRKKWAVESLAIRKRAYSATLVLDELDLILSVAKEMGANWHCVSDIGEKNVRNLVEEVSILYAERELAMKIEGQNRALDENDFRDMVSFCAALPYADCVIAEKQFINLSRQANLHSHFDTRLDTRLEAVLDFI